MNKDINVIVQIQYPNEQATECLNELDLMIISNFCEVKGQATSGLATYPFALQSESILKLSKIGLVRTVGGNYYASPYLYKLGAALQNPLSESIETLRLSFQLSEDTSEGDLDMEAFIASEYYQLFKHQFSDEFHKAMEELKDRSPQTPETIHTGPSQQEINHEFTLALEKESFNWKIQVENV